ncbi:3',5'-cyclic-nucleotide phosphodiesterase regA [Sodiomyces alkalinus F11]|uniref:Phosphodiesterase n=1 Tax=Sodiomyces alkalinus (strain CBS 110278 / VKM F-3762 / F11) TaxID=1314773 RepID=A0A3N2PMZ8_SODAK|nr:3',5'-cyclic-nucleotide phosphodiesterase regA [Sodiomyces alkalinus F11]ROT35885.1 3',5'-cyclic-nucleotide phosphodiesterase regA [Sodiomyces alkalinus F11]
MDRSDLRVVYVNRHIREDKHIFSPSDQDLGELTTSQWEHDDLRQDVERLLESFGRVQLCSTGAGCLATLFDAEQCSVADIKPIMVLIDASDDEQIRDDDPQPNSESPFRQSSTSSPETEAEADIHTPNEQVYGLRLLQRIMTEAHVRNMTKLVVPILLLGRPSQVANVANNVSAELFGVRPVDRRLVLRCLDLGAADVIVRPMHSKCILSLEVHAHRALKDAARERAAIEEVRRGRKRSWVGISEEKPFAYLREAMVSNLMKGICRIPTDHDDLIANASLSVSSERQAVVADAVGRWHFSAHDFTDDELLVAGMFMFRHALAMPELEHWRIPADQLINFLVACRASYNSFVPYHNFRHVIDVLQATFHFLVRIGTIARYPSDSDSDSEPSEPAPSKSPIASLLHPLDGLTLLITAIGHDVGHPGVNNGFLVTLNAPLAQLYNDRSVLESFHCAAFSQILRRYWSAAFSDAKMRKLMISSILATDMGLHFDYMKKLGDLQAKLEVDNTTEGWNGRTLEEQKALACSLLIKCADISNVARKHETAVQWMHILSDEFARQASMEMELEITSSLLAPPKKDIISLGKAQLGFMNMFALPLFQGVADIIPAMQYTVDELERNKELFEGRIQEEQAKLVAVSHNAPADGACSPRTVSLAVQQDGRESSSPATTGTPANADVATPSTLTDGKKTEEKELSPPVADPVHKLSQTPNLPEDYKEITGIVTSFDAVANFAASDPFQARGWSDNSHENGLTHGRRQRSSDTTEESTTGHFFGGRASQATSATTGKMPISPSTRGTSIVSRESLDRSMSVPLRSESKTATPRPNGGLSMRSHGSNDFNGNGSIGKAEGFKSLKKKPSRFRMNNFPFFRRNKGQNHPLP